MMPDLPATRFEHRRPLGEGGMGQVHLVFDRDRGEEVALKLFAPAPGADAEQGRFLFKQEFWAMAFLRHPHLVQAYDYGELADGTPYVTMEHVPGHDLMPGSPDATEPGVRAWLPGLGAALGWLHGQGYVHGDLKPANVRVAEGRATLMDLGLLARSGRTGGPIRGTLLYVAPEVVRQAAVDGRADLYALGAMLYHLLAGRPPFEAPTPRALLRLHLEHEPTPLRDFAPAVSEELAAAVMRLLRKDPAERFASAGALLEALGLPAEDPADAPLYASPLIGRAAAQARLADPAAGALALVGPPGSGRSRLLAEARAAAQLAGLATFVGAGLGPDAPPYHALRPWLAALAALAPAGDPARAVLARVVPGLPDEPAAPLEEARERLRLHAAVADLAHAAVGPALWLVDDADRLDPDSEALLRHLRGQAGDRPWRFLTAGGAAPAGLPAEPLPPLDAAALAGLAAAALGEAEAPAPVRERLPALAEGLPGRALAILDHWRRVGALRRQAGRWTAGPAEAFTLPRGLVVALADRFAALGPAAREVGRVAALLAPAAELRLLRSLVGGAEAGFFMALAELEAADVVVVGAGAVAFRQPGQAEALASSWPPPEARKLHARAARILAARQPDGPDDPRAPLDALLAIARHHLAGLAPLEGTPWALAAARRALALYAAAVAEPLLRGVLALDGLAPEDRAEADGLLATALRFEGRVDEALACYDEAVLPAARAAEAPALADHLVGWAALAQLKGRYADALAAAAEAAGRAEAQGRWTTACRALQVAGRAAWFAGDGAAARQHLADAVAMARAQDLATQLAGALSFHGYLLASGEPAGRDEGIRLMEEAVPLARGLGDLAVTHQALTNLGNARLAAGRPREAAEAFEASLSTCQRLDAPNELVFARLNLGSALLELGRLAEARDHARAAAAMGREQGRKFPEGYAWAVEGLARVFLGELAEGAAALARGLALAREIGNRYLELHVLANQAEAFVHLGRWEAATTALATARDLAKALDNAELTPRLDRAQAALAVLGAGAGAADRVARLVQAARAGKHPAGLAHARRWQAAWLFRDRQIASALAAAREAADLAREAGLDLLVAEVGELEGRIHLADERPESAALAFRPAMERARAIGCPVVEALAMAGLAATDASQASLAAAAEARLAAQLAPLELPERKAYLQWPERAAVAALSAAPAPAEGRREMVDVALEVAAAPSFQAMAERAIAGFVELAGLERGFLLLYRGVKVVHRSVVGMGGAPDAFSTSLAHQVLWGGEPLYLEDAQADAEFGPQASVQALALRTVLGMPLVVDGEVVGVMLADSQRVHRGVGAATLAALTAYARHVAGALVRQRGHERAEAERAALAVRHRVALVAAGARTLAEVMGAVAREAIALTGAERVLLLLGPDLAPAHASDADGRKLGAKARGFSAGIARWVLEHGEPLHLVDAQASEAFRERHSVQALGLRTVFAAPVIGAGDAAPRGVLYLDHQRALEGDARALPVLAGLAEVVATFLGRVESGQASEV